MNSFSSFLFIKCLSLVLILFLSSCENTEITSARESLQKKATRFEQFTTHSSSFSCGITFDKQLFCNEQRVEASSSMFELQMSSHWPAKKVGTGRGHICTIFEGPAYDEIWCKGIGTSGQLGDGLNKTSDVLVKVSGLPETRFIDLGFSNLASCVATESGQVYCWGTGYFPTNINSPSTTAILTPLTGVKALKGNYSNMCALKNDQSLWCWGSGGSGILAQGNTTNSYYIPRQVKDSLGTGFLANVTDFSVGYTNMCAIVSEEVYCWGFARRAGVDQDAMISLPRHVTGLSGAVKIESGDYHTCALLKTGEVYCWGTGIGGLLNLETENAYKAQKIEVFSDKVQKIAMISSGVCASYSDHSINCLTRSSSALAIFENKMPEVKKFTPFGVIKDIEGGTNLLCAHLTNGKLYCLGSNIYGGMNHSKIKHPLVLNPEKWIP